MKTSCVSCKLINIGASVGAIIPKPVLLSLGLKKGDMIELIITNN